MLAKGNYMKLQQNVGNVIRKRNWAKNAINCGKRNKENELGNIIELGENVRTKNKNM